MLEPEYNNIPDNTQTLIQTKDWVFKNFGDWGKEIYKFLKQIIPYWKDAETMYSGGGHDHFLVLLNNGYMLSFHAVTGDVALSTLPFPNLEEAWESDVEATGAYYLFDKSLGELKCDCDNEYVPTAKAMIRAFKDKTYVYIPYMASISDVQFSGHKYLGTIKFTRFGKEYIFNFFDPKRDGNYVVEFEESGLTKNARRRYAISMLHDKYPGFKLKHENITIK